MNYLAEVERLSKENRELREQLQKAQRTIAGPATTRGGFMPNDASPDVARVIERIDHVFWYEHNCTHFNDVGHGGTCCSICAREIALKVVQEEVARAAEADAASLRRENNALAYDKTCLQEDVEALRQAQARLREALNELKAHAEYTLDRSGQRTRPSLFVPSVAKRVLEIIGPALSVDPRHQQEDK